MTARRAVGERAPALAAAGLAGPLGPVAVGGPLNHG